MALTVCLKCDKTYGDRHAQCPHCGTHNFFADDDTLAPAVHVLVEHVRHERSQDKAAKLAELQEVREELLPHTRPWWKVYKEQLQVAGILVFFFALISLLKWKGCM